MFAQCKYTHLTANAEKIRLPKISLLSPSVCL